MDERLLIWASFLLLFPIFWMGILFLLAVVSGWRTLASVYAEPLSPDEPVFRWRSIRLGFVSYNNCVNLQVSQRGLGLAPMWLFSFCMPPLLIPWSELRPEGQGWFGELKLVVLRPRPIRLQVPKFVGEAARKLSENNELRVD